MGTLSEIAVLDGHAGGVRAVAFTPDGAVLATGGADAVRLWKMASRRPFAAFGLHGGRNAPTVANRHDSLVNSTLGVLAVAFSPDGRILATGRGDGLQLRTVPAGRISAVFSSPARAPEDSFFSPMGRGIGTAEAVAFDPQGLGLVAGGDAGIQWWFRKHTKIILPGKDDAAPARSVAYGPDGRFFAAGGPKGLRLWDADETDADERDAGATLGTGEISAVAFGPDGTTLAVGRHDEVALWDAPTRRLTVTFDREAPFVDAVACSPDGRLLAAATWDGVLLYPLAGATSSAEPTRIAVDGTIVRSVAFSPDGRMLAFGCNDGTARLWAVR